MDPRPNKSGSKSKKNRSVRTPQIAQNNSPHFPMPQFANSMPFAAPQMPASFGQSPNAQFFGSTSYNQLPMQYSQMLHGGYAPQYFQSQGSNEVASGMNMSQPTPADNGSYYDPRHMGLLAHRRGEARTSTPVETPTSPTHQFPPFSTQEGT